MLTCVREIRMSRIILQDMRSYWCSPTRLAQVCEVVCFLIIILKLDLKKLLVTVHMSNFCFYLRVYLRHKVHITLV